MHHGATWHPIIVVHHPVLCILVVIVLDDQTPHGGQGWYLDGAGAVGTLEGREQLAHSGMRRRSTVERPHSPPHHAFGLCAAYASMPYHLLSEPTPKQVEVV